MIDAEIALASSWRKMTTRDKLSVCLGQFIQRLKPRVWEPEKRWTLVNRRFVWLDCGRPSSSSATELDQVQEQMKRTQMIVKRNVSDSQRAEARGGKAKTWKNNILMPMLRCLPVVGDAADAAPEQMNSFAQSKTEMFEKIEESLRPHCVVEDLNGDEIMELCILSKELNACETTAMLNPSKFLSCATRLGLREGFVVDLTTARANGTMWELSLEDDRAELRRVQNRVQPELLAGSPHDFSSLLNTCVASQEISKLKTERIEPRIRSCVQAYKLQTEIQKHFVHEHPMDNTSWEMLEVQSLVSDPRVHSIDGPMCRWSFKARGSNDKSRVHEEADKMAHKFQGN